jgi:site-specific recombinase XerD
VTSAQILLLTFYKVKFTYEDMQDTQELVIDDAADDFDDLPETGLILLPTTQSPAQPSTQPAHKNPLLVYIGGLDKASQPTMHSTAKLVAATLSGGSIKDPNQFPWHMITYGVVKRLRSILREQEFSPRSINKALTLIRNTAREGWLLKQFDHEEYQRICEVTNLNTDHDLPAGRVVEHDEIAYLLRACMGDNDLNGLRDAAIIALLAGSGLREKESVKLNREDYNIDRGVIRVLFGKRHKQRESYLELVFEKPVKKFLETVPGKASDPLIPRLSPKGKIISPLRQITTQTVHLVLAKRALQAGLAPFTPHDLRRSFITHQLERGVDPLRLARAVGHSNPKTTMIYDRRTKESDRLAIRGVTNEREEALRVEREAVFQKVMRELFT